MELSQAPPTSFRHKIKEAVGGALFVQIKGKKICMASTTEHLGNTVMLQELERMIGGGAELFIYMLELSGKKQRDKNPLKELLQQLSRSGAGKRSPLTSYLTLDQGETVERVHLPAAAFELLVVISGFPGLLESLAGLSAEECHNIPLVLLLIPAPGEKPAFPQLSSLLKKKGVFFVPFGPLSSNRDKESSLPYFCSRIDLLAETCSAALQGHQLRPLVWDNHHFPH